MQRVYGTAFFSQKELDEHIARLEEAKKCDIGKVGKELGLFTFHQWAPGAYVLVCRKGTTLYNTLVELHARCVDSRRLSGSEGADRVQQGAVADVRALGLLPGQHVPP